MSLLKQQNFLARLYTDEDLRRAFLSEPEKIGVENGLEPKEIFDLASVLPQELDFFADTLVWKRLRETEKFLSLTKSVLGDDFQKLFREFSNQFLPRTIKKHLEDAIEFGGFLQKCELKPDWAQDIVRFEQARLIFNSGAKNFIFRTFSYNLREILEEGRQTDKKSVKRRSYAFWLRAGKRTRFILL